MSTSIFTGAFWRAALERAIKTFAQVALALLAADNGLGLLAVDWDTIGSVAGLAAVVSLLTSIGSDAATGGTGPSFGGGETPDQAPARAPETASR